MIFETKSYRRQKRRTIEQKLEAGLDLPQQ